MSDWQQGDVITNGIRMHYYRTGGDKPPVVLAHGFSDNGLCWTPVARRLESNCDVVMIDARGHGLSEAPTSGYGPKTMAADLAGLIDALGLDRPAVIGHSMGGGATWQLAANYPDALSRAICEDAGPHDLPISREKPEAVRDRFGWIEELKAKTRDEIIAHCREQSPTWSEAELGPWADSKLQLSPNTMGFGREERESWRESIQRIKCPLLIIRADNDKGSGVTPQAAAEAQQLNSGVQVAYVAGAGHNVRREAFEAYMEAVENFLSTT